MFELACHKFDVDLTTLYAGDIAILKALVFWCDFVDCVTYSHCVICLYALYMLII